MFKSKNVNDKRCAYKSKFFNKKIEKDLMIFDIEIDFERQIKALPPLHQFSKFDNFLWVC